MGRNRAVAAAAPLTVVSAAPSPGSAVHSLQTPRLGVSTDHPRPAAESSPIPCNEEEERASSSASTTPQELGHNESSATPENDDSLNPDKIALSLLTVFSKQHTSASSDPAALDFLVSERDVPQRLLPLPSAISVGDSSSYNASKLRGDFDWAPPRPQIVFSIQPKPSRGDQIRKQNFRCAGCGTRVDAQFIKRFRFCHYLSKYFCQCCHHARLATLPSYILTYWDFAPRPISNFAATFLERIADEPVFNIGAAKINLVKKSKTMRLFSDLRTRLTYLKPFIATCTRADQALLDRLNSLPGHWLTDLQLFSLSDFTNIKTSKVQPGLKDLVAICRQHVKGCSLCCARGFVCELCDLADDTLFPFELERAFVCPGCQTCFHKRCFGLPSVRCPKCVRIQRRKDEAKRTKTITQQSN